MKTTFHKSQNSRQGTWQRTTPASQSSGRKNHVIGVWLAVFALVVPAVSAPPPTNKAVPAAKNAAKAKPAPDSPKAWVPPVLPGGKLVVTDTSPDFLTPPATIDPEVQIAKAVPTVDFAYFPGQTYRAEIWSTWGDSVCAHGKYYASLGDHMYPGKKYPESPDHHGAAYVYEYDPAAKTFRLLMNTSDVLKLPEGEYMPGKIHSRLDMGSDGWLYCGTHRGSEKATANPSLNYKGDWILRCNPATGKSGVVVQGPVPKHCIPNSALDAKRMIFYGGTAVGDKKDSANAEGAIMFFAYDVVNHKLLYSGNNGPARGMILASSTGKVYYTPGTSLSPIMCYDPSTPGQPPKQIPGVIGNRTATRETPSGMVYTTSQAGSNSAMYSFNTKTEKAEMLAPLAIGKGPDYVAAVEADPGGRYVYYTLGAHGGSQAVGSAIVQFDTKTRKKKVIAFLSPFIQKRYGVTPVGSFSISVDEKGETVFVTWNCARDGVGRAWDTVGLSVVHIPAAEREP